MFKFWRYCDTCTSVSTINKCTRQKCEKNERWQVRAKVPCNVGVHCTGTSDSACRCSVLRCTVRMALTSHSSIFWHVCLCICDCKPSRAVCQHESAVECILLLCLCHGGCYLSPLFITLALWCVHNIVIKNNDVDLKCNKSARRAGIVHWTEHQNSCTSAARSIRYSARCRVRTRCRADGKLQCNEAALQCW